MRSSVIPGLSLRLHPGYDTLHTMIYHIIPPLHLIRPKKKYVCLPSSGKIKILGRSVDFFFFFFLNFFFNTFKLISVHLQQKHFQVDTCHQRCILRIHWQNLLSMPALLHGWTQQFHCDLPLPSYKQRMSSPFWHTVISSAVDREIPQTRKCEAHGDTKLRVVDALHQRSNRLRYVVICKLLRIR